MSSMKAVRIHAYGSSEVLSYENAPRPTPGEGDVLIRTYATSVNPFDCAMRAGYMAGYFSQTFPLILGTDVSGIIEEVGSGVTAFSPGDPVFTRAGVVRDGAYAEYVLALAADVAAKPQSIDFIYSAAIPHVTLTAWQALFELAKLEKGQTVLIHGAAGGVGHMAAQLAKHHGATVIGTASTNYDLLEGLGVDQAINYSTTEFEKIVHDVDVVLDTIGGDIQQRSWGVLKRGGILVSVIQPPSEETAAKYGVRQAMVFSTPPIAETLAVIAKMVDAGQIKPMVSTVLPLEDTQKAHLLIENKHTAGKIVLQVM